MTNDSRENTVGVLRDCSGVRMLDPRFARAQFVTDDDPQVRCRSLANELTRRLTDASDSVLAVERIIADLRERGHDVAQWDEVVSDAWAHPEANHYLWVVLGGGHDESSPDDAENGDAPWRSASVSFRPRLRDLPRRCPHCFFEMVPCDIRLRVQGHGSAAAPALRVRFEAPGVTPVDALIASDSLDVSRGGFSCTACGSAWFPPQR